MTTQGPTLTEDDNLRVRIAIVKLTYMVRYLMKVEGVDPTWDAVLTDAVGANLEALRLLDPEGTRGLDDTGTWSTYARRLWELHVRSAPVSRKGFEDRPVMTPPGRARERGQS